MKYKNKNFFVENLKVEKLAKNFGTPIYCYSYKKIEENIKSFKKNFNSFKPLIFFFSKI